MTGWKVAASLDVLRDQLDTWAPRRSKASDGAIGDVAHQKAGTSDHLPAPIAGQQLVTARDFTHHPAGGLDCGRLAAALRAGRDPRVKYAIWDRRIMAGAGGPEPWTWRPYSGTNPHTKHLHLSVVADARCQDRAPWNLPGFLGDDKETTVDCKAEPASAAWHAAVRNTFGDIVSALQILNGVEQRVADLQREVAELRTDLAKNR